MEINQSTRWIVIKVEIDHVPGANLTAICEEVAVIYDHSDASIMKSEVVGVLSQEPDWPDAKPWLKR